MSSPASQTAGADESPYDILGVAPDASPDEIKRAYRREAVRHHPDRNCDDVAGATERFKKISASYEILSDPRKRELYDRWGTADEQEIQSRMFGGRAGPAASGSEGGPHVYTSAGAAPAAHFVFHFSSSGGGDPRSASASAHHGGAFVFADPFDLFEQMFAGDDAAFYTQSPVTQAEPPVMVDLKSLLKGRGGGGGGRQHAHLQGSAVRTAASTDGYGAPFVACAQHRQNQNDAHYFAAAPVADYGGGVSAAPASGSYTNYLSSLLGGFAGSAAGSTAKQEEQQQALLPGHSGGGAGAGKQRANAKPASPSFLSSVWSYCLGAGGAAESASSSPSSSSSSAAAAPAPAAASTAAAAGAHVHVSSMCDA